MTSKSMSKPRAPRAKSVKAKKRKTPKEKQPTFVLELPLLVVSFTKIQT